MQAGVRDGYFGEVVEAYERAGCGYVVAAHEMGPELQLGALPELEGRRKVPQLRRDLFDLFVYYIGRYLYAVRAETDALPPARLTVSQALAARRRERRRKRAAARRAEGRAGARGMSGVLPGHEIRPLVLPVI